MFPHDQTLFDHLGDFDAISGVEVGAVGLFQTVRGRFLFSPGIVSEDMDMDSEHGDVSSSPRASPKHDRDQVNNCLLVL